MTRFKTRIVIVLPSLKAGGLERVGSLLANIFTKSYRVDLYLITLTQSSIFYTLDKRVVIIQPRITNTNKNIRIIRTFFWLKKQLKQIKPDSILSFGETYNSFVIAANFFNKYPLYVSNRASPFSSLTGTRGLINPFFYKYANAVILQTMKAKEVLRAKYKDSKLLVIPNPIFITGHHVCDKSRELSILNVGSIGGKKNQDLLVAYFADLYTSFQAWKVKFLGDGPCVEQLQDQINRYNLGENIFIKGKVQNVGDYYNRSSIFAFTSTSEGFPNALAEAMAAGMAVISFDCVAGPSELIDDGINGFLIPLNDHKLYIEKLKILMKDATLRKHFGKNAKEKMAQFDIQKVAKRYYHVLITH